MSKIMRAYKIMYILNKKKIPILPSIIQKYIRFVFSAEIPKTCILQEGVELVHGGLGVVIHDHAIVGKGTRIYPHVVIGGRAVESIDISNRRSPIIGENVFVGAGACIIGNVKIGNNANVGANAVVLSDVPDYATAVGIPARIIIKETK